MKKSTSALALATAIAATLATAPAQAHHAYNTSADGTTTWANVTAAQGYTDSTTGLDGLTRNSLSTTYPSTPTTASSYYQGSAPVSWLAAMHNVDIGLVYDTANPGSAANPLGSQWLTHSLSTEDGVTNKSMGAGFQLAASGSSAAGVDWGYIRSDFAATEIRITVTADNGQTLGTGSNTAQSPNTIQPWLALYDGWDNTYDGISGNATSANSSLAPLPGITTVTGSRSGTFTDGTNNPFGTSGLKYLGSVMNASGQSSITYDLIMNIAANEHMTLLVGGANGTSGNYTVSVSELAAVPIPAAVWLFGSALAAMGVIGRRKSDMAAA